jgi:DNA processing protein
MASSDQFDLLTLCAARVGDRGLDWSLLARESVRDRGLQLLMSGHIGERSLAAERSRPMLRRILGDLSSARDRVARELDLARAVGARLVTVLDSEYPSNLRLVPNLPPFLFLLGEPMTESDLRSVAVVGTRQPSPDGQQRAARLARELTQHGVTVVSGLARGIDAAAHRATLDVGGRTIAVIGTGITRTYPRQNAVLAAQIAERGLLVSQFWPSTSPASWTFPRRNVVMSGIAQGTVVIEASSTSGAKMQARLALEHGKRVFLLRTLVTSQPWAERYVATRGAIEVADVEDVISHLVAPRNIRTVTEQRQLTLDLL